jgi:hypothetical protein
MNKEDTSKLDTAYDELNDLKIHYNMLATLATAIPAFESTPKMTAEEKEIAEELKEVALEIRCSLEEIKQLTQTQSDL